MKIAISVRVYFKLMNKSMRNQHNKIYPLCTVRENLCSIFIYNLFSGKRRKILTTNKNYADFHTLSLSYCHYRKNLSVVESIFFMDLFQKRYRSIFHRENGNLLNRIEFIARS